MHRAEMPCQQNGGGEKGDRCDERLAKEVNVPRFGTAGAAFTRPKDEEAQKAEGIGKA